MLGSSGFADFFAVRARTISTVTWRGLSQTVCRNGFRAKWSFRVPHWEISALRRPTAGWRENPSVGVAGRLSVSGKRFARPSYCVLSAGASRATPLGGIVQHEHVQTGEHEQEERGQRQVVKPDDRFPQSTDDE